MSFVAHRNHRNVMVVKKATTAAVDAIAIVTNAVKKVHRNDIPIQRINRNHHQMIVHSVVQNKIIIHLAIANE